MSDVAIIMGSDTDWPTMEDAAKILDDLDITYSVDVVSAHRMPDDMFAYAESAQSRGLRAIIAGAGGAAHLPGMLAAKTTVPVLGVPVASKHLQGVDSLHSIVQMPKGIPVATFAIGEAGAVNAALFAVAMLANSAAAIYSAADSKTSDTKNATNSASNADLLAKLEAYRARQTENARNMTLPPKA
jgi:5-(carboxyamino)imidazole ribonucleotide mutase